MLGPRGLGSCFAPNDFIDDTRMLGVRFPGYEAVADTCLIRARPETGSTSFGSFDDVRRPANFRSIMARASASGRERRRAGSMRRAAGQARVRAAGTPFTLEGQTDQGAGTAEHPAPNQCEDRSVQPNERSPWGVLPPLGGHDAAKATGLSPP